MSDKGALVQVTGLGHSYGAVPVLNDVSFALHPGEFVGILGGSGSGKSTLLRALAGLLCPSQGRIEIMGQCVTADGNIAVPAEQRSVGLVFQDYALFPHMTVADNVAYGIHRSADRSARVGELLEWVGLQDLGDRMPPTLSGGQRQRVALARALAPNPVALLLDEPFANLDGPLRQEMGVSIREILMRANAGGILVTHDRSEAFALSDRIAVLGAPYGSTDGSTILQMDTPSTLYSSPTGLEAAQLSGPVVMVEAVGEGRTATSAVGEVTLQQAMTGALTLLIRRHQWSFTVQESGTSEVTGRQFVGPGQRLRVRGDLGTLWVDTADLSIEQGQRGQLAISGPCAAISSEDGNALPLDVVAPD